MARHAPDGPIPRRRFLSQAACAVGGVAAIPCLFAQPGPPRPSLRSTVVEVRDPAWHRDGEVDPAAVAQILERALTGLTGKPSAADAWRQLVSPSERVGIKFNKVSRDFSGASQALGDAILDGLVQAGVRRERIIVVEAVGALFPGTGDFDGRYGPELDTGLARTRLTRFVTHQVDALINVPDLKHHERLGFTGALKNLAFGTTIIEAPWRFHGRGIREHIAAVNALPAIASKRRLSILNGLRGIFHRGPAPSDPRWQWDCHSLVVSADPVLLDAVARAAVERRRRSMEWT